MYGLVSQPQKLPVEKSCLKPRRYSSIYSNVFAGFIIPSLFIDYYSHRMYITLIFGCFQRLTLICCIKYTQPHGIWMT